MGREVLIETRKMLGISQKKAAELIGVPLRTWESWEAGHRVPPEYVLRLIVAELKRYEFYYF